jgi:uncharacterized protein
MIFEGEEAFAYPIDDVWVALHDPEVLTRALPGCQSMTPLGNNSYAVALSLGVAAVRGDYQGKVKVTDLKVPLHYMIEGEGSGAPGFVKLNMDCRLERQGTGTLMKWKCDAAVGGLIASIGGKVLSGVSKFMAKQFFKAFKDELDKSSGQGGVARRKPASSHASSAELGRTPPVAGNWLSRFWMSIRRLFSPQ